MVDPPPSNGNVGVGISGGSRELRSFRYFTALARRGNYGHAARDLQITQPALTKHIKAFEENLGIQLLIRHSRGVTLTPAGSRLLEALDVVIPLLSSSLKEGADHPVDIGTLRVGVPFECAELIVPLVIAELRQRWPNMTFEVRVNNSAEIEEALLMQRLELGILQDPPRIDELTTEPILHEELGLICAPASTAANDASSLRITDLEHRSLILPTQRNCIRRRIEKLCFQHNTKLTPVLEIDSLPLRKELVRRWNATTILPYAAAQGELARGDLAYRPIAMSQLSLISGTAFNRRACSPTITEAARLMRRSMIGCVSNGAWLKASLVTGGPPPN